ncbi:MAG: hydantoinase B/oxoprolinase family protein, partial [Streptosporangiaceae bacterium]
MTGARSARATSTVDGVIRNAQIDIESLPEGPWDGKWYSYAPPLHLNIDPSVVLHEDFDHDVDPVTYQVLRSRFWNLNLDHSDTTKRVSGSPLIVYMDDFNTSLLTECGDTLVCGPSIQYFTGHGDMAVKWTLENRSSNPGIREGDVFIQNDPYIATTHQMDVMIYQPLFWDGKLFAWIMNTAHVGDIGGVDAGSFCPGAPDMFHESTPVPPMLLVRQGVMQRDVAEMFVRKSRTPDMIALQLRSQIAGVRATRERFLQMIEEFGPLTVKGAMRRMIKDASEAVGRRLEQVPDGTWRETIYIGSAGPGDRDVHRLQTTLTKSGDRLIFTNEGTDPQFSAANGTLAGWRSGAVCASSALLGYDQLYCPAGVADHLEFRPIPGTMNVAKYPGAVSPGTASIISVYLASQVISKMLLAGPPEVHDVSNAAGGVSLPGWWVAAGYDRNGKFVADLTGDSLNGAIGAFAWRDGVDTGGAWWWPRSKSGNAEEWETALPILYLYRRERIDSGGPGRWRGGNGMEAAIMPHKTNDLSCLIISSDPAINTTPGLAGGMPGHSGDYRFARDTDMRDRFAEGKLPDGPEELEALIGGIDRISPKASEAVTTADVFCISYSAGGGFGDPFERPPGSVADDVRAHRITARAALDHYGVVLDESGDVDAGETDARRASLRQRRLARATLRNGERGAAVDPSATVSVSSELGVGFVANDAVWVCMKCRHELASVKENFKLGAAMLQDSPELVDARMNPKPSDFCDVSFVLRQFICPSCGVSLSIDCCRA